MSDFDPLEAWPFQDEDRHFVSGVNHPGEVKGLALSGRSVGITFTEVGEALLEELTLYAGGCLDVFVDSGAFSEVHFGPQGREVVAPITEEGWQERLQLYRRIAGDFRDHAFLVLPDAVGDQGETFARLQCYASEARELSQLGARLILPVQRGQLDGVDFVEAALKVLGLGLDRLVLGIPAKKAATTPDELTALCRALWTRGADCPAFHLLGMGPKSKDWDAMRDAVRDWFPDAVVYSDSVDVRREVGRTNGRGGGPRRLTEAQDRARAAGCDAYGVKAQSLIETGHEDIRHAAQAARRAGWFDPELESAPGVPLEEGCIEYGPGGPFGIGGGLQRTLDLGEAA